MVYNLKLGEVSEWFKEPLSKSGVPIWDRGFESHPLRFRASAYEKVQ